jgi:outer membrane protein TolC
LQPTLVPAKLFNPNAPEGTFEELVFGRQYVYNVGIQAQWDILNFQKKFTAQTANLQLESSKASTEYARYNLYNQLASTYYSILITYKSLDLYSENVIVTESLLESAKDKFKKGIISEAEVNLAAIQHLQNQKNKETALNNLQQLTIQLQSQLNTE